MSDLPPTPTDTQPLERPANLKDRAYRAIKQRLVRGELAAGTLYSANQFADQLGMSRSPVREAILQLAAEGYLVIDSRGFQVRQFTPREIKEIFEARAIIESYVVAHLAGRISSTDLQQLKQLYRRMHDCFTHRDPAGFLEADKDFHMLLVKKHGNRRLFKMMDNLRNFVSIFGLKAIAHQGRMQEVLAEHRGIVLALQQKDRKEAHRAMRRHLGSTARYLLAKPKPKSV